MILEHPTANVVGCFGIVAEICGDGGGIGVIHEDWSNHLHTLGGRCKSGYGWWYLPDNLALVQAEPEVRGCNLEDFLEDT